MVELEDYIRVHERILRACRAYQATGGKITSSPLFDGEACPMQAVCMEKAGGFGLMWYPWDVGPAHELGISREQVWNFICGFDGLEPGAYQLSGKDGSASEPPYFHLGATLRDELL